MNAIHRKAVPPSGDIHYNNQLQFNLNIPSSAANITTRYHHPGPIILEKVGKLSNARPESQDENDPSLVKLSLASEEKLAWALQLARRDLKNMLHEQRAKIEEDKEEKKKKQNVQIKKKRGKASKKTSVTTKSSKIAFGQQASQNVFKKSVKTQTPPTKHVYYSRGGVLNNLPPGSAEKMFRASTPIRPPLPKAEHKSQTDGLPASKEKLSPNSRQAKEIKKLRHELKFYVHRIENLTKEAHLDPSSSQKDEDEKDILRRKVKRAEQTNRSSRLLYSLQQQVRELQDDLKRAGPSKLKHNKRSQILTRLAAAHRGAVRILQAFLHQLPDQVTDEGTLPPLYQELGKLIHKLSLCTGQLEVDANGIPDDIFTIFEKFQTPTTPHQSIDVPRGTGRKPAPNASRRKLEFGKNLFSDQNQPEEPAVSPLSKEYVQLGHVQHFSPDRHFTPGLGTAQRLRYDAAKQIATPGSVERTAAVKAGLEALMRFKEPETKKRQNFSKTKTEAQKKMKNKKPVLRGKRGVLFPSNTKAFKSQHSKWKDGTTNAHYLQATKASHLKKMERRKDITEKGKPDEKPPWAPGGSPGRFDKSPTQRMQDPEEHEEDEDVERPIPRTKRVFFEDEAEDIRNNGVTAGELPERGGYGRLEDGSEFDWLREDHYDERSGYHGNNAQMSQDAEAMISQAEQRILKRLEPLLAKADDIVAKQQTWQRTQSRSSVQQRLSQKMTDKVTDQAGLLSDLLLEDVLDDTVHEMGEIERQDDAERLAGNLENASTFETMLQTLERMEAEEERIRRRWRRVSYHDPLTRDGGEDATIGDRRVMIMGTPLEGDLLERIEDPPTLHTGIHYSRETASSGRTIAISQPGLTESQVLADDHSERSSSASTEEVPSGQKPLDAWSNPSQGRFTINVPADAEKRIRENKGIYQRHLQRKSHLAYGEFDPWKLISEVADDLVDGILQDVAEELSEFSGGFMDALYEAEFEEKGS